MTAESAAERTRSAALVIIGNEILSGRTQDANLAFIAGRLGARGIAMREVRVVPDEEPEIIAAVDACRARYDLVFTTGGIGPTHDDITAAAIARAFGVALERNPEAVRLLEAHYAGTAATLNEARLRMANIPAGATLIDNPVSRAPGFRIGNVHVLPGVPRIMQAMFDGIEAGLGSGPAILSRTVSCNLGEGDLAAGLTAIQQRWPAIPIGSYPYMRMGQVGTSLVARGTDAALLDAVAAALEGLVRELGGRIVGVPPA